MNCRRQKDNHDGVKYTILHLTWFLFLDNNAWKNTKGGNPGIIDHLNEVDAVKLDIGGVRVYVQEVVKINNYR